MMIVGNAWLGFGFAGLISIRSLDQERKSIYFQDAVNNSIMKKMPFKQGRRKRITYKEYAQRYFR